MALSLFSIYILIYLVFLSAFQLHGSSVSLKENALGCRDNKMLCAVRKHGHFKARLYQGKQDIRTCYSIFSSLIIL